MISPVVDSDRSSVTPPMVVNEPMLSVQKVSIYYDQFPALVNVSLDIAAQQLTAFIGPSGCGKSSLLNCFNRINDLVFNARVKGQILLQGQPLSQISEVILRRRVGMVFQRPNPFAKSVYENVALGLRINGYRGKLDDRVEAALSLVGLWPEVKDRLRQNAMELSGGQQQRLCIARAIALGSEVLLMDEPCASLDPISTTVINNLLNELKQHYTIVVVTHDLKQAAAIADCVAFFDLVPHRQGAVGRLVEYGLVPDIFIQPSKVATRNYMYHQPLPATSTSVLTDPR